MIAMSLKLACEGKSASEGGLTRAQLMDMMKLHRPEMPRTRMTTRSILAQLCGNVCPMLDFVGAKDIIPDLEWTGGTFTYKGVPVAVKPTALLGAGAYGLVVKVVVLVENQEYAIVVKKAQRGALEEADIFAHFGEVLACPGIMSMKPIDKNQVMMALADGDLLAYAGMFSHAQASKTVAVLKGALACMARIGAYYFDIKPANILFTCRSESATSIYLGDIGSIVPDADGDYACSHPPPCAKEGFFSLAQCPDPMAVYTYQLSAFYCQMLTGLSPPKLDMSDAEYYGMLLEQADGTERKLGHPNKYTIVLRTVIKNRSLAGVPGMMKF